VTAPPTDGLLPPAGPAILGETEPRASPPMRAIAGGLLVLSGSILLAAWRLAAGLGEPPSGAASLRDAFVVVLGGAFAGLGIALILPEIRRRRR
jgi:hypothetical protein